MKSRLLSAVTVFALFMVGATGPEASGQGFHFDGGGAHVDVVNPHSYYGGYPYTSYYGGNWGGHADWHNTTHLDYHPGEFAYHRNH